ncbi:hypothetical protein LINPERPRIM_LOCUS4793, partial [Linum perenne]
PSPAPSRGPPLGPDLIPTSPEGTDHSWDPPETFLEHRKQRTQECLARKAWCPKIDPGTSPGRAHVLKWSSRPFVTSPGPFTILESLLWTLLKSCSKQNSKGLDRIEEGRELSPTPKPSPCPDATE